MPSDRPSSARARRNPHRRLGWRLLSMPAALACATAANASHPCSGIPEPAQRLACFDRHHPPATSGAATPSPAVAAASAVPAPAADLPGRTPSAPSRGVERFGLGPDAEERAAELQQISALVREVSTLRHGERVFLLENGQRWAEKVAEGRGPVNPGDRVTVQRAAFGSFLLVTPAGVGLRVRRLP